MMRKTCGFVYLPNLPAAAANANVCHVLCPESGHWMEAPLPLAAETAIKMLSRCHHAASATSHQPR